ncbi:MAG: hypothetical protein Q9179_001550 [Wetmoreana sp. 5 TL-2023]
MATRRYLEKMGSMYRLASTKALYLSIGFSNLWQFLISLLYLAYNSVLTAMLVGKEWDEYGKTRKNLRVTSPQGHQRSSYFVSVPLKYGLPILAAFGALHYTVSQSVFVVYLTRFLSNGEEDVAYRSAASGYSSIAIITSLALGCVLLFTLILIGVLGKYHNGTPLVQWGVVSRNPQSHISHCCFTTAKDVTWETNRPESGHLYA